MCTTTTVAHGAGERYVARHRITSRQRCLTLQGEHDVCDTGCGGTQGFLLHARLVHQLVVPPVGGLLAALLLQECSVLRPTLRRGGRFGRRGLG